MRRRRVIAALAAIVLAALLGACTTAPVKKSAGPVTVAVSAPFTSYNPATSFGATAVNQQIAYVSNSQFIYADNKSKLVTDTSFGTIERVGTSPLRVKYTIRSGVKWSDGAPVDASDLLLAWAANSRTFNTPGFSPKSYQNAEGEFTRPLPSGVVWFDAATKSGVENATALPQIGADGRSITLTYSQFFTDWRTAFEIGLPAHVVGRQALGSSSASSAASAVSEAVAADDTAKLARIARTWNSAFNLRNGKVDGALLVGNGPYAISSVAKDGTVTLTRNRHYSGDHRASIPSVVIRPVPSRRSAVKQLASGAVDVITPSATTATVDSLLKLSSITVAAGLDATFDHLDLQQRNGKSGVFDKRALRLAFLKTVPRSDIVNRVSGATSDESSPRSSFVFFPGTTEYSNAVVGNGSDPFDAVDIAGAKTLVKESGVTAPKVCVLFDPKNAVRRTEFALIRSSAQKAGFVVTDCSTPDWASKLGQKNAYDAALFGWRSLSSDVTSITARLHSGVAALNYNYYASATMDGLLDTLSRTEDEGQQKAILLEIDRTLFHDGYGVPLFQLPSITAYRTRVTGIARSPFAPGVFWNIWEWRSTR